MDYIGSITGMNTDELVEVSQDHETGMNLWSHALIHNCPTRERKMQSLCGYLQKFLGHMASNVNCVGVFNRLTCHFWALAEFVVGCDWIAQATTWECS